MNPSGVRLGTPALTSRGLKEPEAIRVAEFMARVLDNIDNEAVIEATGMDVVALCDEFPVPDHFMSLAEA